MRDAEAAKILEELYENILTPVHINKLDMYRQALNAGINALNFRDDRDLISRNAMIWFFENEEREGRGIYRKAIEKAKSL